jgi:hypothetical protein
MHLGALHDEQPEDEQKQQIARGAIGLSPGAIARRSPEISPRDGSRDLVFEATFTEPSLGVRFAEEPDGRMFVIRVLDPPTANGIESGHAHSGHANSGHAGYGNGQDDVRVGDQIIGVNGEKLPVGAVKEDLVSIVMQAGRPVVLQLARHVATNQTPL